MKRCRKCGIDKPASEFHRHKTRLDGLVNKCKTCTKEYDKKRTSKEYSWSFIKNGIEYFRHAEIATI